MFIHSPVLRASTNILLFSKHRIPMRRCPHTFIFLIILFLIFILQIFLSPISQFHISYFHILVFLHISYLCISYFLFSYPVSHIYFDADVLKICFCVAHNANRQMFLYFSFSQWLVFSSFVFSDRGIAMVTAKQLFLRVSLQKWHNCRCTNHTCIRSLVNKKPSNILQYKTVSYSVTSVTGVHM